MTLKKSGFVLRASDQDIAVITFQDPPGNVGDAWVEFANGSHDADGHLNVVTVSVQELEELMKLIDTWGVED